MKLTFLGTGSTFTVGDENYHSNILLETPAQKRLLIDCGSDARFSLHKIGLSHQDIHYLYISHLQGEHTGGLEWLSFANKFDHICRKPHLYIGKPLVNDLWCKVLAGGLSSLQTQIAKLSSFFRVHSIAPDDTFMWQGVKFQLVQTSLLPTPSFGLYFKLNQLTIFIVTHSQCRLKTLDNYYRQADIIFHDCDTSQEKRGLYTHYQQLSHLAAELRAKMWLYRYPSGILPDAKQDGFKGFVRKEQVFYFTS